MSDGNKKRNKASAGPILMRTAGILFALTAITVWATSFMLAKYTTGGTGTDKGRVAKFSVDAQWKEGTQTETEVDISTGKTGEYTLTLTNNSETAVRAVLELDFSNLGKLASYVKIDDTSVRLDANYKVTSAPVDLAPNGATKDVIITIDLQKIAIDSSETAYQTALLALTQPMTGLSGETAKLPFEVTATFTQID